MTYAWGTKRVSGGQWENAAVMVRMMRRLLRRGEDGVRAAMLSKLGFYTRGKRRMDTTTPD
jgi:hypothetical protein